MSHWKHHKKICKNLASSPANNNAIDGLELDEIQKTFLFPEYNIYVEPEEEDNSELEGKFKSEGDKNQEQIEQLKKEGKLWEDGCE